MQPLILKENELRITSEHKTTGFCVLCSKATTLVCQRCRDFYCSHSCQLRDWQRHRYICIPMPALVQSTNFLVLASETTTTETERQGPITQDLNIAVAAIRDSKSNIPNTQNDVVLVSASKQQQQPQPVNVNRNISSGSTNTPSNSGSDKFKLSGREKQPQIVVLTGFRSPNRCYVCDANETVHKAYLEVCQKVNLLGNLQPKVKNGATFNYVLAKHNGQYSRAEVLSVRPNRSARIFLLDYGQTINRQLHELSEMSAELFELPYYNIMIQLKNVPNFAITDKLIRFLSIFEGQKFKANYDKDGTVELTSLETLKSLNLMICEANADAPLYSSTHGNSQTGETPIPSNLTESEPVFHSPVRLGHQLSPQSKPQTLVKKEPQSLSKADQCQSSSPQPQCKPNTLPSSPQTLQCHANSSTQSSNKTSAQSSPEKPIVYNEHVMCPPFDLRRLIVTAGDGLEIFILENSNYMRGIIGAFNAAHADEYEQLRSYFSNFKDDQRYSPVAKEYIVAKHEDAWYRAKVMSLEKNLENSSVSYRVLFIDFNNQETIAEQNIRRYPPSLKLPCYANVCLIEGFPHKPNPAQTEYFKDKLKMNNRLHVDNVSYIHDMAMLKCKDLISNANKM